VDLINFIKGESLIFELNPDFKNEDHRKVEITPLEEE
jgi:hypothetical protein